MAFPALSAYLCCRDFLALRTPPGFLFPRCLKGFITFLCLLQLFWLTFWSFTFNLAAFTILSGFLIWTQLQLFR